MKIRTVQGIASTVWPAYPIVCHYGRFKAQATYPDATNSRGTLDCILGCTMFSANCIHVGDCWNICKNNPLEVNMKSHLEEANCFFEAII